MIKRFLKWLIQSKHKQWYIRQQVYFGHGNNAVGFIAAIFVPGGTLLLVLKVFFELDFMNSMAIVIALGLTQFLLYRQVGKYWFKYGFQTEKNDFEFAFMRDMQSLIKGGKKK